MRTWKKFNTGDFGDFGDFGVYNRSSSAPGLTIRNSSITGDQNSIFNRSSSALVAATKLDGDVFASGGGFTCVGAYDEFGGVNGQCQDN